MVAHGRVLSVDGGRISVIRLCAEGRLQTIEQRGHACSHTTGGDG